MTFFYKLLEYLTAILFISICFQDKIDQSYNSLLKFECNSAGHSRTIIGVEVLRYGDISKNIQLLVLDPSTQPKQMAKLFQNSGSGNLNQRVTALPPTSPRKVSTAKKYLRVFKLIYLLPPF